METEKTKKEFEEVNMELEQMQNEYQARIKEAGTMELENRSIKSTQQEYLSYMELLEREIDRVNS